MKELLTVFFVWCLACAIVSCTRIVGDALAAGDQGTIDDFAEMMNAELEADWAKVANSDR